MGQEVADAGQAARPGGGAGPAGGPARLEGAQVGQGGGGQVVQAGRPAQMIGQEADEAADIAEIGAQRVR
jgi:hypothetical protein